MAAVKVENEKVRRLLADFLREGMKSERRTPSHDTLSVLVLGACGERRAAAILAGLEGYSSRRRIGVITSEVESAILASWGGWLPWLDGRLELLEQTLAHLSRMSPGAALLELEGLPVHRRQKMGA